MQSVRKAVYAGCVVVVFGLLVLFVLTSCTTPFSTYWRHMFDGRAHWEMREYEPARKSFVLANEAQKDAMALAWAATTSYWLNDLANAERYIQEAELTGKLDFSWFRVTGYKALILLRQGKKTEGFALLKEYIYAYGHTYPSTNLPFIDLMVRKGEADIPRLQVMLEQDIFAYEEEIGLFLSTGVGYYDRNPGAATGTIP